MELKKLKKLSIIIGIMILIIAGASIISLSFNCLMYGMEMLLGETFTVLFAIIILLCIVGYVAYCCYNDLYGGD